MFALFGLVFRRNWGGWCVPPHVVKTILAFFGSFAVAFALTGNLYASLAFGVIIGAAFLNPFHGWGMGMGFDNSGKSTLACVGVMGGSYGAFTSAASAALCYFTRDLGWAPWGVSGFLVPVGYLIAWRVALALGYPQKPFSFLKIFGNYFIDSPTAIGECFLGAVLWSLFYV